ncbi:MAG: hypothetical protein OHK0021_03010 [Bryobacter sp.]
MTFLADEDEIAVIPVTLSPESILRGLLNPNETLPKEICRLLDLNSCKPAESLAESDVALRWVNLDTDAELEAILTVGNHGMYPPSVYLFDRRDSWRMVGRFQRQKYTTRNEFLTLVETLRKDVPQWIFLERDLSGSGGLLTLQCFALLRGSLKPMFELVLYNDQMIGNHPVTVTEHLFKSSNSDLAIYRHEWNKQNKTARHSCRQLRYSPDAEKFVETKGDLCGADGKPVPEKSWPLRGELRISPEALR